MIYSLAIIVNTDDPEKEPFTNIAIRNETWNSLQLGSAGRFPMEVISAAIKQDAQVFIDLIKTMEERVKEFNNNQPEPEQKFTWPDIK